MYVSFYPAPENARTTQMHQELPYSTWKTLRAIDNLPRRFASGCILHIVIHAHSQGQARQCEPSHKCMDNAFLRCWIAVDIDHRPSSQDPVLELPRTVERTNWLKDESIQPKKGKHLRSSKSLEGIFVFLVTPPAPTHLTFSRFLTSSANTIKSFQSFLDIVNTTKQQAPGRV